MRQTFMATVSSTTASDAIRYVARTLDRLDGFSVTGRVAVRSLRHSLWSVEIANDGGSVNEAWTLLTSYGISPDRTLGSEWQTVPGVGL